MINLIIKAFVKDYKNTKDPAVRIRYGIVSSIFGIICNLFLALVKCIIGILSSSISVMADSVNNLSDMISSIISLISFYFAKKPPDRKHPFGHARFEYLSSLFISTLMMAVGFEFLINSIKKIINPKKIDFSFIMILVLVLSIAVKFFMRSFYSKVGKAINSKSLKASMQDSINDIYTTIYVIAATTIEYAFKIKIDGYAGLFLSIFIMNGTFSILKETISVLLGENADEDLVNSISDSIFNFSERILALHDFMLHDYGPGNTFAIVHIEMDSRENPIEAHELIDDIERMVLDKYKINLVVHHDPVVLNNKESDTIRLRIKEYLKGVDNRIHMHDFRIDRHLGFPRVVFDAVLPDDLLCMQDKLLSGIKAVLRKYEFENKATNDMKASEMKANGILENNSIDVKAGEILENNSIDVKAGKKDNEHFVPVVTFDTENFNRCLFCRNRFS